MGTLGGFHSERHGDGTQYLNQSVQIVLGIGELERAASQLQALTKVFACGSSCSGTPIKHANRVLSESSGAGGLSDRTLEMGG